MRKNYIVSKFGTPDEKSIEVYLFDVPMFHKDFHEAEKKGLVYIKYSRIGPDYWDDEMVFASSEDAEEVRKAFDDGYGYC